MVGGLEMNVKDFIIEVHKIQDKGKIVELINVFEHVEYDAILGERRRLYTDLKGLIIAANIDGNFLVNNHLVSKEQELLNRLDKIFGVK